MKRILIKNIKELVQITSNAQLLSKGAEMSNLERIQDAYLIIYGEIIHSFGKMADLNLSDFDQFDTQIDASNRLVFPSFCDSHTHLVYAGSREIEYVDKIKGLSYEEIAKRGGGILNSAKRLQESSEEELLSQAQTRINEIISMGTGAVEIKSGYGLNFENEIKMLRVIQKLKDTNDITIKSTFLGAHAVPAEYKRNQSAFIDKVVNEWIPYVGENKLADFIDVFCDKGFFTIDETDRMLATAAKFGLRPKIHANELANSGGIQIGVKHNALSVDHLEFTGEDEILALKNSKTMPTILPGAAFFLGMQLAPARQMINAGLPIALASDFNPGSSPSGNMQLIASMGSILFKLTAEEVIHATTLNTAYAMNISDRLGSIEVGKIANVWISKPMPNIEYLPYSYGDNKVETVILKGKIIS